jgi:ribose-phosphate pyrophosphokinase
LVADVAAVLGLRHFTARKQRTGDHDVDIDLPVGADFIGRPVVIVDDIVSSGVTIATLSRRLSAAGASRISVYAVHALHDAKAASLMRDAGVRNVVSVDGITHETNAISIVDIFAEALGTST